MGDASEGRARPPLLPVYAPPFLGSPLPFLYTHGDSPPCTAAITVLWAIAASLVPQMQKGNNTARRCAALQLQLIKFRV